MTPAVRSLIEEVHRKCAEGVPFDLWVPDELTAATSGEPTGVVMAIVTDAALSRGFWPNGFVEGEAGRHYRYKPNP